MENLQDLSERLKRGAYRAKPEKGGQNRDVVSMLPKISDFVYYRTIRKWLQTLNTVTEANCRYDWWRVDRIRMTSFLVEDKVPQPL